MSKHTPGPLIVVERRASFALRKPGQKSPVAVISTQITNQKEEADAIALACTLHPEFLQVLKLLITESDMSGDGTEVYGEVSRKTIDMARAAISKAKGAQAPRSQE